MKKAHCFFLGVILALFNVSKSIAQDIEWSNTSKHSILLKSQFFQIKDELNYGLTFSGINLMLGYDYSTTAGKKNLSYSPELGFGANFNIGTGLAWRFKPIHFTYTFKVKNRGLTVGGYFATDYQWQQYSELQGGRLFWFHTIELGPMITYITPFTTKNIRICISNSFAGFTSRPNQKIESYYYSLSLSEFISTTHRNLEFGLVNLFNRSKLSVDLIRGPKKRLSFGYEFEYFGYFNDPGLSYLNHGLSLRWKIGNL
jgi:hypothetical protein